VSTLARVYDHLLGAELTRTTDFGSYIKSLCLNIADIQATSDGAIKMTCDSETLVLDLDVVTALGLVVVELVTNSYDHAFPGGQGEIIVSAHSPVGDSGIGTIVICDNGPGFTPEAESKRHGLGLVQRLIEQVRGTIAVKCDLGTVWTITFPTTVWEHPMAEPISV
jgi:two-component sensor histidine kinase